MSSLSLCFKVGSQENQLKELGVEFDKREDCYLISDELVDSAIGLYLKAVETQSFSQLRNKIDKFCNSLNLDEENNSLKVAKFWTYKELTIAILISKNNIREKFEMLQFLIKLKYLVDFKGFEI